MYALPMNVGELSCFAGAVVGAALAGATKPARRRATREMRATVFIGELLSKRGVNARFILPFLQFGTTAFFGWLRLIRFSTKLLKWKAVSVLGSVQVGDEERPLPAVLRP